MLLSLVGEDKLWLRRLVGVPVGLAFLFRFFFGTLFGTLLLSFFVYFAVPPAIGIEPWTLGQMVIWFDELGNDAKIGLATSLVTVLGFFIAVGTAMHSWQRQTAAMMRMSAADAIDRVLADVVGTLLRMSMFMEATAKEVSRVRAKNLPLEDAPLLSVLAEDVTAFRADRQRLLQLEQEVLALPARYAVLFLPLSGIPAALEAVGEHVANVAKKVWVPVPAGGTGHPEHRKNLMDRIDPQKCTELSEVCDLAHEAISGVQGAVRGALLSPLMEANAVSFARTMRAMFWPAK